MHDHLVFLKEFLTKFEETGSAIPSSSWAAKAMTNSLRRTVRPQSILEVGPGTGSVTTKILNDMVDGDHLTVCEINPRFMSALKEKISDNKNFLRRKQNIDFFEGPIQEMPEKRSYDIIICALPFTNLKVEIIEDIFAKFQRLSTADAHITFFEYMGLRRIGRMTSLPERRERLEEIDALFEKIYKNYDRTTKKVWFNFTPINVYTLKSKLAA